MATMTYVDHLLGLVQIDVMSWVMLVFHFLRSINCDHFAMSCPGPPTNTIKTAN